MDIAFQSKLSVDDGTAGAFQDFPDLITFTVPKRTANVREKAVHSQTDRYRRKKKQLLNTENLKAEGEFNDASYKRLVALFEKTVDNNFKITLPVDVGQTTARVWAFAGQVAAIEEIGLATEGMISLKFEVFVDGKMTETDPT